MAEQIQMSEIDWRETGYRAYPFLKGKPPANTNAERLWCLGWEQARKAEQECSDQDWEWGRNTFAADYK